MTKVMVVDVGARGHAIAEAYRRSHLHDPFFPPEAVVVTPGNEGISYIGSILVDGGASVKDPASILAVARRHSPDLIEVAQDDAIALGTCDLLREHGYNVFGPSKDAARIEWDKIWARDFMRRHNIPSPENRTFDEDTRFSSVEYAESLIKRNGLAFFKASGLASGKGVIPVTNSTEIDVAFHNMRLLGDAGKKFLVEEGMKGEEFSYYALVSGEEFVCFPSAQDNKRLLDGDQGPMTGGMGCHSPALVTRGLERRIESEIIRPTVEGLAEEGRPYFGILYLGGMVCEDGSIKVVEFNSRWGDPEAQVILPGVKDYRNLVQRVVRGEYLGHEVETDSSKRVCVVGTSKGYPGKHEKGRRIFLDDIFFSDSEFYSAGIGIENDKPYTKGGRLFSVVGKGDNIAWARTEALRDISRVYVEGNGLHYRTDIAWRDVERALKRED